MEFAIMTLVFWLLMFVIIFLTGWIVKEALYIVCLLNNIKSGNRYAKDLLELDYQKIYYILNFFGYFDIK